MKPWIKWGIAAVVLLLLVTAVVGALSARKSQQRALAAASAAKAQTVVELAATDVLQARTMELSQGLPISGSLKAVNSAFVKARVAGELQGLTVREGDFVKAGQVLARIDASEYQSRVRQAQEQADAARAQIDIVQRQFDNNKALVDQGFISKTALDTSQANLDAAQSTYKAALAGTDVARKSVADTVLRSPISGQVSQRLAQPGERVGVEARIVEIVDLRELELEATLGAAESVDVRVGQTAELQIEGVGQPVVYLGAKTGRDGVGGATGSSKEHTDTALENSAEVQKGDAPTERKIQRLFRNPELTRKIKICNDFGAGGISVAIGEIAPSLEIDLDAVSKKYDGLDGTELAISESQERMAICVDRSEIGYFIHESDKENLECRHVANVTNSGRLVMTWRGKTIVNLSRAFLDTNGVQQSTDIHVAAIPNRPAPSHSSSIIETLSALNICSQKGLGEIFDASVGAGTVLWPFGGDRQLTPPDAMVAKLPLLEGDTDVATFMSWGFNPEISSWSPFHGALYAVTESVCKAVAAGARLTDIRLTLQEYFPKLGNDPTRWGLPFAALLGAWHAQHGLRLAAIGGKDSMSGSFNELDVPPTLVSFALAPGLASLALSPEFKKSGSQISFIQISRDADHLPDLNELRQVAETLHQLNSAGKLHSLHHIGQAGIAAALAKMAFGNHLGADVTSLHDLAGERYFAFLVEHTEALPTSLRAESIGRTTADSALVLNGERYPLSALLDAWTSTLEPVYPTRSSVGGLGDVAFLTSSSAPRTHRHPSKPKVLIPSFPGTNSEYDSAKAFREAGADAEILVFRNLTSSHIEESLTALAAGIRGSQILMLPGGFSAGDEPDGSAKFIATILRNPRVADAIMDLLKNRDGLILGVCNGFQALVKTGLVPYGEIRDAAAEAPTLVHNGIGRHISCYARTRVVSTLSPWLAESSTGDIHRVPVSHGEGKFFASPQVIAELGKNGQIATLYCDESGVSSMDIAINPNGSLAAIEGITSPCGRVFGKMAHTERSGRHVAKNIPGGKHQPIFTAGVRYFQ